MNNNSNSIIYTFMDQEEEYSDCLYTEQMEEEKVVPLNMPF